MNDYVQVDLHEIYQANNLAGLMAEVPSAAFDPIFWVHHAKIDFLWWRWDFGSQRIQAASDWRVFSYCG